MADSYFANTEAHRYSEPPHTLQECLSTPVWRCREESYFSASPSMTPSYPSTPPNLEFDSDVYYQSLDTSPSVDPRELYVDPRIVDAMTPPPRLAARQRCANSAEPCYRALTRDSCRRHATPSDFPRSTPAPGIAQQDFAYPEVTSAMDTNYLYSSPYATDAPSPFSSAESAYLTDLDFDSAVVDSTIVPTTEPSIEPTILKNRKRVRKPTSEDMHNFHEYDSNEPHMSGGVLTRRTRTGRITKRRPAKRAATPAGDNPSVGLRSIKRPKAIQGIDFEVAEHSTRQGRKRLDCTHYGCDYSCYRYEHYDRHWYIKHSGFAPAFRCALCITAPPELKVCSTESTKGQSVGAVPKRRQPGVNRSDNFGDHYVSHLRQKRHQRNKVVDIDFLFYTIMKHSLRPLSIIEKLEKKDASPAFDRGYLCDKATAWQTKHPEFAKYRAERERVERGDYDAELGVAESKTSMSGAAGRWRAWVKVQAARAQAEQEAGGNGGGPV